MTTAAAQVVQSGKADAASSRGAYSGLRLLAYAGIGLTLVALTRAGVLRKSVTTPVALGAVAIAMWHGAYDAVQSQPIFEPVFGTSWKAAFVVSYLGLAGMTLLGWALLPVPSLVLFLGYSAWHFGTEPEHQRPSRAAAATGFAMGALPIVSAAACHPEAVSRILSEMLGSRFSQGKKARIAEQSGATAHLLTGELGASFLPILIASLVGIGLGAVDEEPMQRLTTGAATVLTAYLFRSCDPLIAFAVYFCGWHTPEHLVSTSVPGTPGLHGTLAENVLTNLRAGMWPWIVSLGGLACLWVPAKRKAVSHEAELFIVLSVLTVPHMALNEARRALGSRPRLHQSIEAGIA
jgi:Brp/Blh family beta-carotene 15,15'-monooxygenase